MESSVFGLQSCGGGVHRSSLRVSVTSLSLSLVTLLRALSSCRMLPGVSWFYVIVFRLLFFFMCVRRKAPPWCRFYLTENERKRRDPLPHLLQGTRAAARIQHLIPNDSARRKIALICPLLLLFSLRRAASLCFFSFTFPFARTPPSTTLRADELPDADTLVLAAKRTGLPPRRQGRSQQHPITGTLSPARQQTLRTCSA